MPGVAERLRSGPITYEATSNLTGGQVVIPSGVATQDPSLQGVQPAGDAALNVVGVANKDAVAVANQAGFAQGTTGYPGSFPVLDASVPSATVACPHDAVKVTYAGACAYGAKICSAANGAVRAWVSGTDSPAAVIGRCAQPGGVASAGAGLARILV